MMALRLTVIVSGDASWQHNREWSFLKTKQGFFHWPVEPRGWSTRWNTARNKKRFSHNTIVSSKTSDKKQWRNWKCTVRMGWKNAWMNYIAEIFQHQNLIGISIANNQALLKNRRYQKKTDAHRCMLHWMGDIRVGVGVCMIANRG